MTTEEKRRLNKLETEYAEGLREVRALKQAAESHEVPLREAAATSAVLTEAESDRMAERMGFRSKEAKRIFRESRSTFNPYYNAAEHGGKPEDLMRA